MDTYFEKRKKTPVTKVRWNNYHLLKPRVSLVCLDWRNCQSSTNKTDDSKKRFIFWENETERNKNTNRSNNRQWNGVLHPVGSGWKWKAGEELTWK